MIDVIKSEVAVGLSNGSHMFGFPSSFCHSFLRVWNLSVLRGDVTIVGRCSCGLSTLTSSVSLAGRRVVDCEGSEPECPPCRTGRYVVYRGRLKRENIGGYASRSLPRFILGRLKAGVCGVGTFVGIPFRGRRSKVKRTNVFGLVYRRYSGAFFRSCRSRSGCATTRDSVRSSRGTLGRMTLGGCLRSLCNGLSSEGECHTLVRSVGGTGPQTRRAVRGLGCRISILATSVGSVGTSLRAALDSEPLLSSGPSCEFCRIICCRIFRQDFPVTTRNGIAVSASY